MTFDRIRQIIPVSILLALAMATGPIACSEPGGPGLCTCTEEFRSFTVKLFDSDGSPLKGVDFEVTILRTGENVPVIEWVPGVYTVLDDNSTDQILPNEVIRVTAVKDGTIATQDFIFTIDEPCRCHVQKVSGPDVIILDPAGR